MLNSNQQLTISNLVIVHDDISMDLGQVKISKGAGAGNHNGVVSIINHLKTKDFIRIRCGIGRGDGVLSDVVLSKFRPDEKEVVAEMVKKAIVTNVSLETILLDSKLLTGKKLREILQNNFGLKEDYDLYVGTSTGSLIAPLTSIREMSILKEGYTNITSEDIFSIKFPNAPRKASIGPFAIILKLPRLFIIPMIFLFSEFLSKKAGQI